MAAARYDSKKRKFSEGHHPIQPRAKPSSPMILPASRRKPTNVLPPNATPSVVRKLATVLPRMHQSTAPICAVPVPVCTVGTVRKVVMADNTDSSGQLGARSVDAPAKPKPAGPPAGGLNAIVSFAGSGALQVSIPARSQSQSPAAAVAAAATAAAVRTIAFAKCSREAKDSVPAGPRSTAASETIAGQPEAQYNVAPGWRRVVRNQVVVYISPSEKMLHNLKQVREYLLSAGTCKCGLPCPFHPDVFFQFDCQVPNLMLETSKNGKTLCSHSFASSTVRSETAHTASVGLDRKNPFSSAGAQHELTTTNRKARSGALKKIPSWRKSVSPVSLSNPAAAAVAAPVTTQATKLPLATKLAGPLSTTFVFNTQAQSQAAQTKPLSISIGENQIQTTDYPAKGAVDGGSAAATKSSPGEKKVTFKDDPTGYLNQQTAMLHSSISILHSPDRRSPGPVPGGVASNRQAATVSETAANKAAPLCRSKTVNRIVPMVHTVVDTLQKERPPVASKNRAPSSSGSAPIATEVQLVGGVRRKCNQKTNNTPAANVEPKASLAVRSEARSAVPDPCSPAKQTKLNPARNSEPASGGAGPFVKLVNTSLASCQQMLPAGTMAGKMEPTSYPANVQTLAGGSMASTGTGHIVVIDQNAPASAEANHFQLTGYPVRPSPDQCYIGAAKPPAQLAGYDINRNHVVGSDGTVTPVLLNGTNIIVNNTAPPAQMLATINGVLSSETANTVVASSRQPGVKAPLVTNELGFALASPPGPPTASPMVNMPADTSNNGSTCFTSTPLFSTNDSAALSCFTSLLCKPAAAGQLEVHNSNPSVTAPRDRAQDSASIRANKLQTIKRAKVNPTIVSTYSNNSAGNILLSSPSVELQQPVHHHHHHHHHPQPSPAPAMQLQGPFVQVNPYASLQNIQLTPSLAGITVVPASKPNTLGTLGSSTQIVMAAAAAAAAANTHTQLHHHNQGQPAAYNLLGHSQTILLPTTGMIVAADATNTTATLLQVQSVSQCTGGTTPVLTAPAGLVLRTQSMPTGHSKPTASFLPTITHQPFTLIAGSGANGNGRHVSPGTVLQPSVFATSFNGIRSGDSAPGGSGGGGAYVGSNAATSSNVVGAKSITQLAPHCTPLQLQPPIALAASGARKVDGVRAATADTALLDAGTPFAEPVLVHCDTTARCHAISSESFSKFGGSPAEVKVADSTASIYYLKEGGCAAGIDGSTSTINKCTASVESVEPAARTARDKQPAKRTGPDHRTVSLTSNDNRCAMLDDNGNETNRNGLAFGGDGQRAYPLPIGIGVSPLKEVPRSVPMVVDALEGRAKQHSNGAVN
ncbi:uncharacterized protein LOC126571650 isoform X2 [Anopheles aquasalis]|uniref:uncharacterized protein LOC126571650 isoform X2 n=1 Tax=Anopheles aquasalis TaxID=42839 RepID=UPI00215ACC02|nr:uncharacterized protein LOC126571650 isoform X2 [Anopheles aquasalis]